MGLRNLTYGIDVVEAIASDVPRPVVVVTMEEPWAIVSPRFGRKPEYIVQVKHMEEQAVVALERSIPLTVKAVLGVGGGAVMDMAKYIHWKRGIPLHLMPTIASVDAAVTPTIAVRKAGRVRYVGEADPVLVGVDFPVIQSAPVHLNRAGVGDILSIHTALWDWKLSHKRGIDPYAGDIAAAADGMLDRMVQHSGDLRDVTETGIRLLFDLYNEINYICEQWGNSRPEEGSEHFFTYNLEDRTGRSFIHGEIVCLGVYVLSYLQGNDPQWVHAFINDTGVRYRLHELGVSVEDFRETLLTLQEYVERENLFYSVINGTQFDKGVVDSILADLDVAHPANEK